MKTQAIAWTGAQVIAITQELPEHMSAMAPLGASCGHRQGALIAVAVDDLDFLRKTCHIEWQVKNFGGQQFFALVKNKKTRDVPVADYALFALARHMKVCPPVKVTLPVLLPDGKIGPPMTRELIFTRLDGRAHTRMSVNVGWNAARKRAGIPFIKKATGQHVLRHTAATNWLANGLSLAKVAAHLGDTQAVVLDTYSHVLPNDDDRAREISNVFFAPRAGQVTKMCPRRLPGA